MPFQMPFEENKRRLNGVFPFSQSQGVIKTPFIVSNGPIYRLFHRPINNRFKLNFFND